MLDSGSLRVGSERYTNENGSRGLATLLCAHVHVRKECLELKFPAKSGKDWESEIYDADLAALVRTLKRRGGNARLLAFKEGRTWRPVTGADINAYVKERTGLDFTAKDFRTLHGTVAAAVSLARSGRNRPLPRGRAPSAWPCWRLPRCWGTRRRSPGKAMLIPGCWTTLPRGDHRPQTPGLRGGRAPALLYREGDVVPLQHI
ncbi:DNA topoisomerase 1B [Arthrobacter sp. Hiyo4]|nr:DNA topoisomerase 1B [Arthrobacter sp. Hiyo4]